MESASFESDPPGYLLVSELLEHPPVEEWRSALVLLGITFHGKHFLGVVSYIRIFHSMTPQHISLMHGLCLLEQCRLSLLHQSGSGHHIPRLSPRRKFGKS